MRRPKKRDSAPVDTMDKVNAIIDAAKQAAADAIESEYVWGAEIAESPIEKLFLAQILHPDTLCDFQARVEVLRPPSGLVAHTEPPPIRGIYVYPQITIGEFRVDFLLRSTLYGEAAHIIVECDGHEFHEKTKEQAQRDKARDRYLVSQGYRLIRFTGSEIYRDPEAVAREAIEILLGMR